MPKTKSAETAAEELSPRAQKIAVGCVGLFALPFAAGGVAAAWMIAASLWSAAVMRDWVETPARLLESDFKQSSDSDGGSTGRATARYEYSFAGQRYESKRVAVDEGSDNIGAYHRDRAAELQAALESGGEFRCYVNPDEPSEAVLFRDLRWGLQAFKAMFALMFGGVGFGILAAIVFGGKKVKERNERQAAEPGRPWLWRDDWAAGLIRPSAAGRRFVTAFALFWNLVSWPVFLLAANTGQMQDRRGVWVAALFPLVGTGLAAWCGYQWLVRLRWGVPRLEMASVPGVLGGTLAGVVHVDRPVRPRDGFALRLACVRSVTEGSGKHRTTREDVVWEQEKRIARDLSGGVGDRTAIPVQFWIPLDLPNSSADDVTWRLEARAETAGVDFAADFELPVYRTEASRADAPEPDAEDDAALAPYEVPPDFATSVRRMGARLERDAPGGRTLLFPLTRNWEMSLFLLVFTVVWTAVTVALFASQAPRVIAWIFAFFDALIVLMTVTTCFRRTRLSFGADGVTSDTRLMGFGRPRSFRPEEIRSLAVDRSGTTFGSRAYRQVTLQSVSGGQRVLVSEIAREADAQALAEEIRRAVGLSESRTQEGRQRMSLEGELPPDLAGR
jgi:hypothetical protein